MSERCERCWPPGPSAPVAAAIWLAAHAGGGGDLGTILRTYRQAGGLTQQQVADLLGFDRTYISMIECGRRRVTDRSTLAHFSRKLAIPPHVLGIVGADDANFTAMLAFGTSVIRLARVARYSGRAADAVSELWPLITRLEARVAAGHAEPETMSLLAQARVSLGVALGHLLPEERLDAAIQWTGRALRLSWHLGDCRLLAFTLRMHGNELRKAGRPAVGVMRLRQSLQIDDDINGRGAGLVLLARAAAEVGDADMFDAATDECVRALDVASGEDALLSAFTVREVRLRGLLAIGRGAQAAELAEVGDGADRTGPPTPQWRVIEQITTAEVLARSGDERTATGLLSAAVSDAETLRLPHQIQRVIRLTDHPGVLADHAVREQARAVLTRLDWQLAGTAVADGVSGT